MKTSLPKASRHHEERIREIANIIVKSGKSKIAFVILFGSFASGNWVHDRYTEDRILYEYASDYDFLIITKTNGQAYGSAHRSWERRIYKRIDDIAIREKHKTHIIIESIERVNSDLERSQYFFSDIKKEGVLLYDSGEFKLAGPRKLEEEEKRKIAKEDYDYWFSSALGFFRHYGYAMKDQDYRKAAFHLHQAAENLYVCYLLAVTGYKPKSHDLKELGGLCSAISNDFLPIFPLATKEQEDCFDLLRRAYIEARYNKHYLYPKNSWNI